MSGLRVSARKAVFELLSNSEFATKIHWEETYVPEIDVEEYDVESKGKTICLVGFSKASREWKSRNSTEDKITIDVAIRSQVNAKNMALLDERMDLVEAIETKLFEAKLVGDFVVLAIEQPVFYQPDRLREGNEFVSLLRVTLRNSTAIA